MTTAKDATFSYTITATNTPTSYNAANLPAGLSVNTSTGVISGRPTVAGVYSITLSATNAAGTGTAILSLTVTDSQDTEAPVVAIARPSSTGSYTSSASNVSVSGTSSDNVGVTEVTYTLAGATTGSGTAALAGDSGWSMGLTLNAGTTTVTVSAKDASGNAGTARIDITFSTAPAGDTQAPTVAITQPANSGSYSSAEPAVTMGGTVSDNVGVTSVSYALTGATTGSGSISPDAAGAWTAALALQEGVTTVTVTATDAAGNAGRASIQITYSPAATPGTVSGLRATAGDSKVDLAWTNPSGLYAGVVVLRRVGDPVESSPTDGTQYATGDALGRSSVVFAGDAQSYNDTNVTNGSVVHYAVSLLSGH